MKRISKGLLIGFLSVIMTLFWTVGCSAIEIPDDDKNSLAAVKESSISASLTGTQLKVEWGAVEQATSYLVNFKDTTLVVNAPSTTATFTDVEYVSGSLTITIAVQADGRIGPATSYTFTPSANPPQPSTLATPAGLYVNNGTLEWNQVPNATSYTVSDGQITATVNTTSISLVANGFTVPASGNNVTYTVVAKASGYKDSAAASYTYTAGAQTLTAPTNLAVNNGILTWTATNATSYTVSDGTKTVTVNTNSISLAPNGLKVPTSGSVTYTVVAKASGYNDSPAASYTYTVTPLTNSATETPAPFANSNATRRWSVNTFTTANIRNP